MARKPRATAPAAPDPYAAAELDRTMRRDIGPGWETSTPGIQALANFNQRKTETLDAARRGDLTLATQLGGQGVAQASTRVGDILKSTSLSLPFFNAGTTLSQAFSDPIKNLFNDRALNVGANVETQKNRTALSQTQNKLTADMFSSYFGMGG